MTTNAEKLKVLKMIQDRKITAEEAGNLLDVLEKTSSGDTAENVQDKEAGKPGRWLKIRVTEITTGRTRVNIRLPISLINSGVKLGMKFAPGAEGVNPEKIMEAIREGGIGKIIDVFDEDDNEHVEIWVE